MSDFRQWRVGTRGRLEPVSTGILTFDENGYRYTFQVVTGDEALYALLLAADGTVRVESAGSGWSRVPEFLVAGFPQAVRRERRLFDRQRCGDDQRRQRYLHR